MTQARSLLCIGHRGAMGYEPENTLRSFEHAITLGCPWIELDVYAVDDQLIVIHDDRLERTTNGGGLVQVQSFDYLRSLDAGKGERIPTLLEVLELVNGRCGINIELKGFHTAEPTAALLQTFLSKGARAEQFLLSSFNHRELQTFRGLLPEIKIGALIYGIPLHNAALASELGAYSVHCAMDFVDSEFVEDAHARGLKVFVYAVNELEDLDRMAALGVDGVFSNYPDRVLAYKAK